MILDTILHGDALERLRELPDNSIDAIVTDPPAGISFMGKDWDNPDYFPYRNRNAEAKKSGREEAVANYGIGYARGNKVDNLDYSKKGRDAFISSMSSVMQEAARVLKPGGHALVWALPRTSHWTALALEDAGFEIRDCVYHLFGSGFPKSLDVSKAIDKMAGAERQVVGSRQTKDIRRNIKKDAAQGWNTRQGKFGAGAPSQTMEYEYTAPATPDAREWDGWGTALKPAVECWWLCRKPLAEPTVAKNVLKWGTGAINVDGCRVGLNDSDAKAMERCNTPGSGRFHSGGGQIGTFERSNASKPLDTKQGRWPANLVMSHTLFCVQRGSQLIKGNASGYNWKPSNNDNPSQINRGANIKSGVHYGNEEVELWECAPDCPVAMLDQQSGTSKSTQGSNGGASKFFGVHGRSRDDGFNDIGGASRYFSRFQYTPKASRAERNRGCEELPEHAGRTCYDAQYHEGGGKLPAQPGNHHPTVKPLALMRWLIRLITPPGGVVLDCFAGSGSTLVAAKEEGFSFIGIEREQEYFDIATARLKAVS